MRNLFFFVRILEGVKRLFGPVMFWITVFVAFMLGLGWAASVFADYSILISGDSTNSQSFGDEEFPEWGQPFLTEGTEPISSINAEVFKSGSPADGMIISIQEDVAGEPSGTDITVSDPENPPADTCGQREFVFTGAPEMTDATQYWLIFKRSGTPGDTGSFSICSDGAEPYAVGPLWYHHNGDNWTEFLRNAVVELFFVTGGGGGGEPTATTTASTVINNPNQDFFNGVLLFLVSFFGTVWLFRRRT